MLHLEKSLKMGTYFGKFIANPLYHWSHLELAMYFDVHEVLNEHNADQIYNQVNSYLQRHNITAQSLITQSNVKLIVLQIALQMIYVIMINCISKGLQD